jgi:hypothetical protein
MSKGRSNGGEYQMRVKGNSGMSTLRDYDPYSKIKAVCTKTASTSHSQRLCLTPSFFC